MSAVSADVVDPKDIKKNKEKMIQAGNWILKQGDLDELLSNENSVEVVIFEKRIMDVKQDSEAREVKKNAEARQPKALKIVLCRTKQMDLSNPKARFPTGKKLVTAFILFGNGSTIEQHQSEATWESLDELCIPDMVVSDFLAYCNYRNEIGFPYCINAEIRTFLKKPGSLDTNKFLSIITSEMRKSFVDDLFEKLHEFRLLDDEDCQFLKTISQYRALSAEEIRLSGRISEGLSKKDYKIAIEAAQQLHELSRKQAAIRGSSSTSLRLTDGSKKYYLIDDCDAAFQLGELLEALSPLDAIEAFKILMKYDDEQAFEAIYLSPYLAKAKEKVSDIRMNLIGLSQDEAEKRKLRGQAIKTCFMVLEAPEHDLRIQALRQFLNLLETQCGFEPMDPKQRLFKHLTVPTSSDPRDDIHFIGDVILTMADKIYQQQKAVLKASSSAEVQEKERKIRVEGEEPKIQSEKTAQVKPKKPSAASQPIKALDESDDEAGYPERAPEKKKEVEMASSLPSQAERLLTVQRLLQKYKTKSDGDTLPEPEVAFRRAAAAGEEAETKVLVESVKSLDINQPGDKSGRTALHVAAIYGKENVVSQLLFQMKARRDIKDAQGKLASDYAKESGNARLKKLFESGF